MFGELFKYKAGIYRAMAVLGVFLIVFPKVNLISVPGQSAGLRIDDLIIAILFVLIMISIFFNWRIFSAQGYVLWIIVALVSFLLSSFTGQPSSPLYVFRLVEYYAFFYFGYCARCFFSLEKICVWILNLNALAILLQFFGIWGGFSSAGYVETVGRCIGLTAGPWEVGFLINSIYVVLRCFQMKSFSVRYLFLFMYTLVLIVMTGARIPLLCHLLLFVLIEYSYSNRKSLIAGFLLSVLSLLCVVLFTVDNQVVARSKGLFSVDNIDVMLSYYDMVNVNAIFHSFPDIATGGADTTDMSWLIRASHWVVAIKTWALSLVYIVFGVGVGTFGPALDGAWIRIVTETGLLGLLAYIYHITKISSLNSWTWFLALALAINMMMIDIHISYKSMAFILFVIGYVQAYNTNQQARDKANE